MKRFYGFSFALMILISGNVNAKTWTITAVPGGGSFVYSVSSLPNVAVGDVLDFQMNFGFHTLVISMGTTTVLDHSTLAPGVNDVQYTVTAPGNYSFHCTIHAPMTGTFTASAAGVDRPAESILSMDAIFPNPAMEEAMVHFTLEDPAHVTLRIYNALGNLVQTPTNEEMTAGFHMLMIDTKLLAAGSYQYVLQAGDAVLRRDAIVVK